METIIRKRVVGAAVLIAVAIVVSLLLSRCVHRPIAGDQPLRVYEITPSGKAESVAESSGNNEQADDNERPARDNIPPPGVPPSDSQQPTELADKQAQTEPPKAAKPQPAAPVEHATQQDSATVKSPPKKTSPQPADKQAAAKSEQHKLRRQAPAGSWVVQVASFGKEKNAKAMAQQLSAKNKAFYTAAKINGQTWYRVRVGPFNSDAEADNAAAELRAQGRSTLVVQVD